jgi:CheY-like chemotaxis protein
MFGPAVARPKKRLLVVDDDDDYRDILAHFLAVRYEVATAQDGIDGLEQASRLPPDLIINDVAMPRLGGIAMVHHLRASFGLWVPFFFSAGWMRRSISSRAFRRARGIT